MPKVALLLSGKSDIHQHCASQIYNTILGPLNPDVYIYATGTKEEEESMKRLYRPKKMVVEDKNSDIPIINCTVAEESNKKTVLNMTRAMYECYNLIDSKDHYDWIIRTRLDLVVKDTVFTPQLMNQLDPTKYYIPEGGDFRGGKNDVFAIGSHENMKHYCNLYNMIPYYTQTQGRLFHPEALLGYHLEGRDVIRMRCYVFLVRDIKGWGIAELIHGK